MGGSVRMSASYNMYNQEDNGKRDTRLRKLRKVRDYLEAIRETKQYKNDYIRSFIRELEENVYQNTENGKKIQRAFEKYEKEEKKARKEREEKFKKNEQYARNARSGRYPEYEERARYAIYTNSEILEAYETLGLEPNASMKEIKTQYRKLALKLHPNKNHSLGATKRFQKLNEAYEKLMYYYRTGGSKKRTTKKRTTKKKTTKKITTKKKTTKKKTTKKKTTKKKIYKNIPGYGKRLVRSSKTGKKYVLAGGKKVRV
jgi:DnaJ-domain-containing protein 1